MTFYGIIFYLLAILLLVSTALAISRSRLVHTVVYLILSFFATALLFYLLGAPFLAAAEVIVYAGAIMVMFLFIIMTLRLEEKQPKEESSFRAWVPAILLAGISLVLLTLLVWAGPDHRLSLKPAMASPREFGAYIFREFWFSVELTSFLLFVALVGALYLGRKKGRGEKITDSDEVTS